MCAVIKTMYVSRYGWVNFGDSLGCVWIHKTVWSANRNIFSCEGIWDLSQIGRCWKGWGVLMQRRQVKWSSQNHEKNGFGSFHVFYSSENMKCSKMMLRKRCQTSPYKVLTDFVRRRSRNWRRNGAGGTQRCGAVLKGQEHLNSSW
jgi:hypothetical protein